MSGRRVPVDGLGVGPDGIARVVVVSRSQRPGCDIDFLCGTIAAGARAIDWGGPCGALAAAVGGGRGRSHAAGLPGRIGHPTGTRPPAPTFRTGVPPARSMSRG